MLREATPGELSCDPLWRREGSIETVRAQAGTAAARNDSLGAPIAKPTLMTMGDDARTEGNATDSAA